MAQPHLKLDLAPHERQLGKYRLLAKLGEGGMGTVYLALASGFGSFRKLLVVKELRRDLPWRDNSLAMFMDEAQLAARLDHPNVLQTFEAGEADGRYFLAMEYLDGQPLSVVIDRARRSGGLPLELWVHVLCETLAGLSYAHELADFDGSPLNVVHRDVSPQNVFVTYHGQVKVVDFGVAKANNSNSLTNPGMFKGKFAYAAPEQLLGRPVDARCDVFAVGVMLWEVMSRRRFSESTPSAPAFRTRAAGLEPRIRQLVPHANAELADICDRALQVEAEDRFESADALRLELVAWLAAHGGHVRPAQLGLHMRELFSEDRKLRNEVIEAAMLDAGATQSVLQQLPAVEPTPAVAARVRSESGTAFRTPPRPRSESSSAELMQAPPSGGHAAEASVARAPSAPPPLPTRNSLGDTLTPSATSRSFGAPQRTAAAAAAGALPATQPDHGFVDTRTPGGAGATLTPSASVRSVTASSAPRAQAPHGFSKSKPNKPPRPQPRPPWASAAILVALALAVFITTYRLSSRVATRSEETPASAAGEPAAVRSEHAPSEAVGATANETSVHAVREGANQPRPDSASKTTDLPGAAQLPAANVARDDAARAGELQRPDPGAGAPDLRAVGPALPTADKLPRANPDPMARDGARGERAASGATKREASSAPADAAAVRGSADLAASAGKLEPRAEVAEGRVDAAQRLAREPGAPQKPAGRKSPSAGKAGELQPGQSLDARPAAPQPTAADKAGASKGRSPVLRVRSDPALGSDLRELKRTQSIRIDVEDPYQ